MYPPKVYQESNFENALLTIRQFPLATLITPGEDPLVTHMPLIYFENGSLGKLKGHMDKFNPQCDQLNGKAQAIFHGPDVYISPNYYTTEQFPTWNYLKVHVKGELRLMGREETRSSLIEMTAKLENKFEDPWQLDAGHPRLEILLDYIMGFEFEILEWEAKFKIGQDKIERDKQLAKAALEKACTPNLHPYINLIFENHKNMLKD